MHVFFLTCHDFLSSVASFNVQRLVGDAFTSHDVILIQRDERQLLLVTTIELGFLLTKSSVVQSKLTMTSYM